LAIDSYLKRAELYAAQLEQLHLKEMQERLSYLSSEEVEKLPSLLKRKCAFSKECAELVGKGEWKFQPLVSKEITVKGKKRELFHARSIEDLVVYQAISRELESAFEPFLSSSLYSFRKNRHFFQVIQHLITFLSKHRHSLPLPRSRGLYLFKVDVKSYYESIPTEALSPLWNRLFSALKISDEALCSLLKEAISPQRKGKGVPVGHPLSAAIANFYLSELDCELAATPNSFYARYCDDLIFVSPLPDLVKEAMQKVNAHLAAAKLELNSKKTQLLFWNGAGRASQVEGFTGKEAFTLLGYRLHFNGTVSLPKSKTKKIMKEVGKRFYQTCALLHDSDLEEKCQILRHTASQAFTIDSPLAVQGARSSQHITNLSQIKQLRYLTALKMAIALTKKRGVRAFRQVRPSALIKGRLIQWKK
jgi:hypothetical protein